MADHPEKPSPRLVDLIVMGAERSPSGVWCGLYSPGRNITIGARVDPVQSAPHIIWEGGQPGDSPQERTVPLDAVTPFDEPIVVQATLDGVSKSARLKVVPRLLRMDVSGAERTADGSWHVNTHGDPVVVRAALTPSVPGACRYLRWTGGGSLPHDGDNCSRLVPPSAFTDPHRLPVDAEVIVD